MVDPLLVSCAFGVEVRLYDGPVAAQKLEVDLVLGLVALQGGEVEVEVEAARVAGGTPDEGGERTGAEAGGGAPPRAAAVVVGEGDGVGGGAVGTGLGGVVDRNLLQRLGRCIGHWNVK